MNFPLKILSSKQIRQADFYTIKNEPIKSIDLMERAALKCFKWIQSKYDLSYTFYIFCGSGNNGGDGLAIARMLNLSKYKVYCYQIKLGKNFSNDFLENKKRLETEVNSISQIEQFPIIKNKSEGIIIDSILGSGLNRNTSGLLKEIICKINQTEVEVVSIDMPSGLFSEDNSLSKIEGIIKAKYTLCFNSPKLSFVLPENYQFVGEFHVLDIGLDRDFISSLNSKYYYLTKEFFSNRVKFRNKFDHKGSFGHLLIVSGSKGMMGSTVLTSRAALSSGVGKLSILSPKCGEHILQTTVIEGILEQNNGRNYLTDSYNLKYDWIVIGPGIGTNSETKSFLISLLKKVKTPIVLDADAINIISNENKLLSFIPENSILTPHPKEFERLAGKWKSDINKLSLLKNFSKKYKLICILKGANTSICLPNGNIYFNSSGNPGMASAGSGDVLTGIIGSLLAQGYSPEISSKLGVYIHGLAGDYAKEKFGEISMTSSNIQEFISLAFKKLTI